jgi:hypothetical protein
MPLEEFLGWQVAEVCEAADTDLINVFQICSSAAFGLASTLVSPYPSRHPTIARSAKRILRLL